MGNVRRPFGLYTLNNQLFSLLKYILEISSNFKTWWAGNGRKPKNTPIQSPNKKTLFVPTCQTNCRTNKELNTWIFGRLSWLNAMIPYHMFPNKHVGYSWKMKRSTYCKTVSSLTIIWSNINQATPKKKLTCPKFLRKFPFEHGPFLRGRIRSFSGLW